ncbi:carboxylesterase/lipase family protein [Limnovirga soli]|uniref:Carboxylic ester hydrolase n=1 Tax=Limnovirga soli TaxID=2656915 RepID=A0A8J8FHB4_9BACT|nr:carboxylesterase/lipase family protein [Limnovirga soli]NNV57402.1 carboxylesterase family protein [Limnovirga soli]
MKKITSFMVLLAFAALPILSVAQNNGSGISAGKELAIVQTESGKVKGYIHDGIYTYKGIPYAQAQRFMAPAKPTPWQGIRSSMTYGPVCPTDPTTTTNDEFEFPFNHNWGYTNENCLSLNVWTQQINATKKRPVMVWLHGGGFTAGSSIELPSYDGESLTKKGDVVVVSVNHRLNILGFLDLSAYGDKYKSSANAGLMDLIAALEWVKQNIAQFGGDPDNVTIFGQSGGGGKVTCLMNAPSAKGLFNKAIVQSGSYITDFMDPALSKQIGAALLQELNLQPDQVDSLQKISYERLNAAGKKALAKVQEALKAQGKPVAGFGLGWGPILDGMVLPYHPTDAAATALAANIPLLVGSTKNEFTPFMPGTRDINMDQAKANLQKKYGDKADAFMAAVLKAYPNTVKPSDYTDLDLTFRPASIRQANLKATTGTAPVYMYLFTWQSPVNDGIYKAMHCIDLPFQFNNIQLCQQMTGGGKDAYTLAAKMSQAWINFATTGNPNAKGLPKWPAYSPENGATMIFDTTCELKNSPDKELLEIANGK